MPTHPGPFRFVGFGHGVETPLGGMSSIFSMLTKQEYQPRANEAEQKKKRQRPRTPVERSERHWRIQRIKQRLTGMCNGRLQKQMPVSQIHPHHPEGDEKPDGVNNTKRDGPKDALPCFSVWNVCSHESRAQSPNAPS
jgi:hypothetical protein